MKKKQTKYNNMKTWCNITICRWG